MMVKNSELPERAKAVILTALPVEYKAVLSHLTEPSEVTHPEGTVYERGYFTCRNGESISVAIVEIGAGNPIAAVETERAAQFFCPDILLFVGVAGGLKDVQLGDVVVATKVYGYEAGKAKDEFEPRPNVGESSYPLVQRARAESHKREWLARISHAPTQSTSPNVFVAPIAAGEKVVADKRSSIFKFLRRQYGDALAVEMEGRGFLQAAHANANTKALIVRGISDLISAKAQSDNAGCQKTAAENASAFAFEVLARIGSAAVHESGDPDSKAAPPQKATILSLHQLLAPPADFTGRQLELDSILAETSAGAAIAGVKGMGGIGKTALALKLADQLKDRFPDAQFYLNLRGSQKKPLTAVEALTHVIRAFNPTAPLPESKEELQPLYLSVLHLKKALILLDDASGATQVEPLLPPSCCFLLITSRNRFTLPGLVAHNLDTLPPDDAQALLIRIAPRIGDQAETVAKLCGYLPLALRVAGSALAEHVTLSVREYVKRLSNAADRLELVEASLSLSFELLSEKLRGYWSQLAVFPGDFDRSGAQAVWSATEEETTNCLDELVRHSLIEWDETKERFRLHDVARVYADSRLKEPVRSETLLRHAGHYLELLEAAEELYLAGKVVDGLALCDRDWTNILAGQAWSVNAGKSGLKLCNAYPDKGADVLDLRLHAREKMQWLESALDAARHLGDRQAEGCHLGNLGLAYFDLSDPRKAIEHHEQYLVIAREIGDRRGEGNALGNLGNAYRVLGDPRKAIECYEQALVIDREIGDRRGEGADLGNLGLAYAALGDPRKAIECYEQALVIDREIGDRRGEGADLGNLGLAYADLGDPRKAIEHHEQYLVIARAIGDRRGEGNALGNLGNAYADLGDPRKAIEYYEQALVISREIGDRRAEGSTLGNLGVAYRVLGDPRKAIEYYEQQLAITREIGDRLGEGEALGNLGNAHADLGDPRKAIECYEQALVIDREIGDRRGEANASWNLGLELEKQGDLKRAVELMQLLVDYEREIGHPDAEKDAKYVEKLRAKLAKPKKRGK